MAQPASKRLVTEAALHYVNARQHGAKGDGVTDDTASIQAALNAVSGRGGRVVVSDGTYMIKADNPATGYTTFLRDEGGISVPSNVTLEITKTATLKAIPNAQKAYNIVRVYNRTNVLITGGGTIQGDIVSRSGSNGEWGYGVAVTASTNVAIENVVIKDCMGDGINLQKLDPGSMAPNQNVTIRRATITNCGRQGISLEGVIDCWVEQCTISGIGNATVVPGGPWAGIDIEPWLDATPSRNIHITNNAISGCKSCGVLVMNGGVDGVHIDGNRFDANLDSEAQVKFYTTGQGMFVRRNTFTGSVAETIRFSGGSNAVAEGNTLDSHIFVTSGPGNSTPRGVTIAGNYWGAQRSGAAQCVLVASSVDVDVRDNLFDLSADESMTAVVDYGATRVRVRGNKFRGGHRAFETGAPSHGVALEDNEIVGCAAEAFVIVESTQVHVARNQFVGCAIVDAAPLVVLIGSSGARTDALVTSNVAIQAMAPEYAGSRTSADATALVGWDAYSDVTVDGNSLRPDGAKTLPLGIPALTGLATRTAATTMDPDDRIICVNPTAAVTITLPAAAVPGDVYTVKNMSTYTITVAPSTGTIDGAANKTLTTQYAVGRYALQSGTAWITL